MEFDSCHLRWKLLATVPSFRAFQSATSGVFEFSKEPRLWALAFDLETGAVVADELPEGLRPVVGLGPWAETFDEATVRVAQYGN